MGGYKYNRKILSPDELNKIKNVFVIIVMGNPLPIMTQMKNNNIEYMHISELHFSYYEKSIDIRWLAENCSKIENALQVLDDDKSREIFTKVFLNKIYCSYSNHPYQTFHEGGEYFSNGLWELGKDEAFVDGGAYIGDTIDDFLKKTDHNFDAIYSFEYEKSNYVNLKNRMEAKYSKDIARMNLYNLGIWNKNETGYCAYFGASDGTQIVNDQNTIENAQECRLASLDTVLRGKRVTVLKFDIEGAEMRGLQGAQEIIRNQKPKLAICLYHRPEDLWEIPCKIHEINPDYRMIVKHHSGCNYTDTVLYAK